MANVIQLKRVTSGTSAPGTSDLAEGELAINTNTGKLYFKDASNSIKFFADSTQSTAITFGIANTNAVKIDHASVADDDYAKFTANGVEGRSFAEVKTDLSLNNVENTAISSFAGTSNITTTGALNSGSITSGFGNIDNGSSTLDTGALTSTASTIENSANALLKISTTSGDGDSVASITFKNDNNTDGSDNN